MKPHPLDQLRDALRAKGYSRAYTARLVAELHDHLEATREARSDQLITESQIEQQLGSPATLVAAVEEHPELRSWSQRFPLAVFVVLPAMVACCMTLAAVWLAECLARGDVFSDPAFQRLALRSFAPITLLMSTMVILIWAILAVRARAHTMLLAVAMLLLSATAFFVIDLAFCDESGGSIAYSHFGFDVWKFTITLIIFAAAWSVIRRHSARLTLSSWRWGLVSVATAAGLTLFAAAADFTAERVRRHPADNLIRAMDSPDNWQHWLVTLLSSNVVLDDLGMAVDVRQAIHELTDSWDRFKQQAVNDWQSNQPDLSNFGRFERKVLRPRLRDTAQALDRIVSSAQRQRLQQIRYQRMGWDALYLNDVQRQLRLSAAQRAHLKDLLVEHTLRNTKLRRERFQRRRLALTAEQPALAQWYAGEIQGILTTDQLDRLQQLQGARCPLPIQLTISY